VGQPVTEGGIENHLPFLDLTMIKLGQRVLAAYKLKGDPVVEKWILRKAFEDLLPHDIVWRKKEQFDEGSGSADMLQSVVSNVMTDNEKALYQKKWSDTILRSSEECHYHKLFVEAYENPDPILKNVGRWAERPDEIVSFS